MAVNYSYSIEMETSDKELLAPLARKTGGWSDHNHFHIGMQIRREQLWVKLVTLPLLHCMVGDYRVLSSELRFRALHI